MLWENAKTLKHVCWLTEEASKNGKFKYRRAANSEFRA